MTGGTFLTTFDLINHLDKKFKIYVLGGEYDSLKLYSFSKHHLELIEEYPRNFRIREPSGDIGPLVNKWSAKDFHNSWLTHIYFKILTKYNIDFIHIMHLIYHSFDLPHVAKKLDIPVVLSMHDFYFLCPFYTLLDENNKYCSGKCSNNNENCYVPWNILEDINSKGFISEWREHVLKMFSSIDYFIAPSYVIKDLFLSIYDNQNILNEENFKVIEHGRDFPKITKEYFELPNCNKPIKILCLANNLDVMKGSEVIESIKMNDIDNRLEFHFLGNCEEDLSKYGISHGKYDFDEFYEKIHEIKPSFIGIFSIWPESFCHTLTEAWSCHIPVIGSNIGVVKDRILRNDGGWIIDVNDPKKAYELIIDISENVEVYCNVVNNLKMMEFKTVSEMVDEYMDVYDLVESNETYKKY